MSYFVPDPERAANNIETFLAEHPECSARFEEQRDAIAPLFSHSQFLAAYAVRRPEALFRALDTLEVPFTKEALTAALRARLLPCGSLAEGMREVRLFRKDASLIVTLKDVLRKADLQEIMRDISTLADAVLTASLEFVEPPLERRYGAPKGNALAVIGLGKLGAGELNYSSDVDIIFVYRDEGETSGVATLQGVTMNRVSAFEYYCKLAEELTRFLSANTEDGFAYRVDLRLRPQGQRGSLALSLRGHEEYYESWGQLWERAALLRARCVAGDEALGREFEALVRPFVYRKYLDFQAIDEIRRMKAQVEQLRPGGLSRDIKRGYGGIREIEFFIQIFQLIYGGKEPLLRERSTLKTLHSLLQKGFIGHEDFQHLSENYLFLRALEHRLQQLNDLQTHALPSGERELDILGRKMGFGGREEFLAELERRRRKVRAIYDSLLEVRPSTGRGAAGESRFSSAFWDAETPPEALLSADLAPAQVKDMQRSAHYLGKIRNTLHSFQTIRGRRLLEQLLPRFTEAALREADPDHALLQLVDFSSLIALNESYLEAIAARPEIIETLTFIFAHSAYLSKIFMSTPQYIGALFEGEVRRKRGRQRETELEVLIDRYGPSTAIRLFRKLEEILLGILFLNRDIGVEALLRSLSGTAELVLSRLLRERAAGGLGTIGFGKLGGREITFHSDLDLIFVTPEDPTEEAVRSAEGLVRVVSSYTKDGIAYALDTRLRPQGSKGPLVSSLTGLADYYLKEAQPWEVQALLKARPLSGDNYRAGRFMELRRAVLTGRGRDVTADEVRKMRERIVKELSKESSAAGIYDLKLGSGGLEELEFTIQYLQLSHCAAVPSLLVQGTAPAIDRLGRSGILSPADAAGFKETYGFYRTVETVLRLRTETVVKEESGALPSIAAVIGMAPGAFVEKLKHAKAWVRRRWETLDDASTN